MRTLLENLKVLSVENGEQLWPFFPLPLKAAAYCTSYFLIIMCINV